MEGGLVVDQGFCFRFGVLDDRDRVEQLWLNAGAGVTVAAGGDAGFFRILGEKLGRQTRLSITGPHSAVRRNAGEVGRRLGRVMTLDALNGPRRIVFAAVVLDVVESYLADL